MTQGPLVLQFISHIHIHSPLISIFFSAHQGLQGLAKAILNVNMTKDKLIRCGDWEAEVMSEDQVYSLTLVMLNVFIYYTPSRLLSCKHAIFQI